MAVTSIRKIRVRYVRVPPEEAERRRRALLELQARSILKASRAGLEDMPDMEHEQEEDE